MNIFILANEEQKKEILAIPAAETTSVDFAQAISEMNPSKEYNAYFILRNVEDIEVKNFNRKPVFINQVIETLSEGGFDKNVGRINAWPGFLERPLWEVASDRQNTNNQIFEALNRKIILVKDEPGMVSARVISMIVNEAFFALGEKISTQREIDLAMKLGTNYPYGPFEWVKKVGIENMYVLLEKLAEKEDRYQPAPALKKLYLEITQRV